MSFGFSVGDFVAVGQLCWKVYKKCKDSPGNYAELSSEVSALYAVIKETEELLSQQNLSAEQEAKLRPCQQGCEMVLKDLDGLLVKYESLGTKSQRAFDRMGFGNQDIHGIRLRLLSNVTMLDTFNNASSHARLERKLNLLIAEVRAGKREGSVVSTRTFDTAVQNDRETWDALRRELEDIGISPGVINEKRSFIVAWFQEAVAAGKLEEDVPSEEDEASTRSESRQESLVDFDFDASAGKRNPSNMMTVQALPETTSIDEADSAISPEATANILLHGVSATKPELKYNLQHGSEVRHGYDSSENKLQAQSPKAEDKLRPRVSYLLSRLRSKETQLLKAAQVGDIERVRNLILEDTNNSLSDEPLVPPLHLAASYGNEQACKVLLEYGDKVDAESESRGTRLTSARNPSSLSSSPAASRALANTAHLLLNLRSDVENQDEKWRNPFREITTVVRSLFIHANIPIGGAFIERRCVDGSTALMYAARFGHTKIVQILLQEGADVKAKDSKGETALIGAASIGRVRMIQSLVEKGADIDAKTYRGTTALMKAAKLGHSAAVNNLLEAGADMQLKNKQAQTALSLAHSHGHTAITNRLVSEASRIQSDS